MCVCACVRASVRACMCVENSLSGSFSDRALLRFQPTIVKDKLLSTYNELIVCVQNSLQLWKVYIGETRM